jgi:hypothetical protein
MEKSMQQVQSQNEKMVPIDTSGDPVEIELKEEEVKEGEVKEDNSSVEVKEEIKEEHKEEEEYSQTVKKRIDKLTFKIREAERQKEEALKYAQSVKKERDEAVGKVKQIDSGYLDEYKKRVQSEMDKAQSVLQQAINSGDAKAQVEANKAIARLAIEEERADASIKQRENKKESPKKDDFTPPPTKQQPDPKAEAWAEKNEWFGTNEAMTYTVLSIHKKLIQDEGFDGKSDEYYKELDKRIKKEFPHKFEDKDKSSRVVQTVASANRSTKSGRRTVKLTPSQVAIAKKLGVPLEEYAKHVKEA